MQTPAHNPAARPGHMLADLTWREAERVLTRDRVVLLPLGAGAKEHGPHLRLDNDLRMADYLARRVCDAADVVVLPTVNYHFYPAFLEYPGSTHLNLETSRDLVIDIVHSVARHGPRRFYTLNTGVSTKRPLKQAAARLAKDGVLMRFTDILGVARAEEERLQEQQRGTHADELETSMMLYIAPDRVDMGKAQRDDAPQGTGGLTRDPDGEGTYSPTGAWGDPTLATRAKGEVIVEATVRDLLAEIAALREADVRGD
ncbi:creatininase family protein [Phycisphaeraceae bacterium D3-23]